MGGVITVELEVKWSLISSLGRGYIVHQPLL
jgi:hypothetical protein